MNGVAIPWNGIGIIITNNERHFKRRAFVTFYIIQYSYHKSMLYVLILMIFNANIWVQIAHCNKYDKKMHVVVVGAS